jgi:hypothetical protein
MTTQTQRELSLVVSCTCNDGLKKLMQLIYLHLFDSPCDMWAFASYQHVFFIMARQASFSHLRNSPYNYLLLWHYSLWWSLVSSTTFYKPSLSCAAVFQFWHPSLLASSSIPSIHLSFGRSLPFCLPRLPVIILLATHCHSSWQRVLPTLT